MYGCIVHILSWRLSVYQRLLCSFVGGGEFVCAPVFMLVHVDCFFSSPGGYSFMHVCFMVSGSGGSLLPFERPAVAGTLRSGSCKIC